jgi:hypothetical protein
MRINKIECIPGYPVSGDNRAFTAMDKASLWGTRIQRVRMSRTVAAAAHKLVVTTDVPGAMSACSLVRRP